MKIIDVSRIKPLIHDRAISPLLIINPIPLTITSTILGTKAYEDTFLTVALLKKSVILSNKLPIPTAT
jgi:hypothetical protein